MAALMKHLIAFYFIFSVAIGMCQEKPPMHLEKLAISGSFEDVYYTRTHGEDGTDTLLLTSPFGPITSVLTYEGGMLTSAKEYFSTGTIYREFGFRNGVLEGQFRAYHPNGNPWYYIIYDNGEATTPKIEFDSLGNLCEIEYGLGDTIYEIVEFTPGGQMKARIKGRRYEDKDDHSITLFYETGVPYDSSIYNQGVQPYIQWHTDGKVKLKGFYENTFFSAVGQWKEWHPNGQLSREYTYSYDMPNRPEGDWRWYDENGNLVKWEVYREGSLVSIRMDKTRGDK